MGLLLFLGLVDKGGLAVLGETLGNVAIEEEEASGPGNSLRGAGTMGLKWGFPSWAWLETL